MLVGENVNSELQHGFELHILHNFLNIDGMKIVVNTKKNLVS